MQIRRLLKRQEGREAQPTAPRPPEVTWPARRGLCGRALQPGPSSSSSSVGPQPPVWGRPRGGALSTKQFQDRPSGLRELLGLGAGFLGVLSGPCRPGDQVTLLPACRRSGATPSGARMNPSGSGQRPASCCPPSSEACRLVLCEEDSGLGDFRALSKVSALHGHIRRNAGGDDLGA